MSTYFIVSNYFSLCIEQLTSQWCRNNQYRRWIKVLQWSFCDPWGYKVFSSAGGLNNVPYANRECEAFREPIQAYGFFWDFYGCFCFLKAAEQILALLGKPYLRSWVIYLLEVGTWVTQRPSHAAWSQKILASSK